MLEPPRTIRLPTGRVLAELLDEAQGVGLGVARGDIGEDGDGPFPVAPGDGLQGGLLIEDDERGQRDEVPVAGPDAQPRDVLGPRPLPGHELEPDVETAAARAVFPDPDAADQGVDGRGHVVDGDADVGAHGPVGRHPQLGHADAVVRVEVDDDAAGGQIGHDFLAEGHELGPIGAAHGEFDREAALGGEALLGGVLDDGPQAGDGVELPPEDGRELGLVELPFPGRDQGHDRSCPN